MKREKDRAEHSYLGVWDPAGGEIREGSGLPVEEGQEEIRIVTRLLRGKGKNHEISREELKGAVEDPDLLVWIDVLYPREGAAALLRDSLELGALTVEDCMEPLRMPKMDVLSGDGSGGAQGAFVAAFAARLEDEARGPRLSASEVDLVAAPGYLVTLRDGPVDEVERRLDVLMRSPEPGASGAALAHAAFDGHPPVLVRASTIAEELEEVLDPRNERASISALEALITLRRDLLAFRRLAVAQSEILRRLARISPEVSEYLSDVADNQREAVDMADATRDYIEGAVEAYRVRRDERSDAGIRRLTILAGIIGPLTLLNGIYATNFPTPGTEALWGFWAFIGIQFIFLILAVLYFRRRGLL
jgi:magnesium transporter